VRSEPEPDEPERSDCSLPDCPTSDSIRRCLCSGQSCSGLVRLIIVSSSNDVFPTAVHMRDKSCLMSEAEESIDT